MGPSKNLVFKSNQFLLKFKARVANGRAGIRTMFVQTAKLPEPGRGGSQPIGISLMASGPACFYPVRPSTRHHVG
jgi:hypothetical protein